jgi:hypothetical protein
MFAPYPSTYTNPYGQQLAQNRLNQMEQQYNVNQYGTQYPMQQPQQAPQYIKGRPVSSFDEAKAIAIDWDGSIFVFTDVANKKIYTKQIMLDGTAELKTYVLAEPEPAPAPAQTQTQPQTNGDAYVLRSDFELQIEHMQAEIEELKKGGNVDESTRSNVKQNVRKQSSVQKSAGNE